MLQADDVTHLSTISGGRQPLETMLQISEQDFMLQYWNFRRLSDGEMS